MLESNDKPQDELFYALNLDEIVPQDHFLRDIDRVLDIANLREHLAPSSNRMCRCGTMAMNKRIAWAVPT